MDTITADDRLAAPPAGRQDLEAAGAFHTWAHALASIGISAALSSAVLISSLAVESRLGAPVHWTWLLTGLQVTALWGAGGDRRWGWFLGASVQPAWIVYAVLTGQLGFVPGCAVSGLVQAVNALRRMPTA